MSVLSVFASVQATGVSKAFLIAGMLGLELCALICPMATEVAVADDRQNYQQQAPPQARTGRTTGGQRRMFRDRVVPHWSQDGDRFWYRNDLADSAREFVVVDAAQGRRELVFTEEALLSAAGNELIRDALPIDALEFAERPNDWVLITKNKSFLWNSTTKSISAHETPAVKPEAPEATGRVARTGAESELTFDNRMNSAVELFWLDGDGGRHSYGKVAPGTRKDQHTFGGHRWLIVDAQGESLGEVVANDTPSVITIDGRKLAAPAAAPRRNRNRRNQTNSGKSPDGKWLAEIKDGNVVISPSEGGEPIIRSSDGSPEIAYGQLTWSPDSKAVVAWRREPGEIGQVHLVQSSPPDGGRALLDSRDYALPGDKFPRFELNLFRIESRDQLKPEVDRFEHEWQSPRVRWLADSSCLTYELADRGHQRYRLISVSVPSGAVKNLVDERSQTFIWTAHTENSDLAPIHYLSGSQELIYLTEQSGWRHLQLLSASDGRLINHITTGQWVVRGIEEIDEDKRQVWFRASGMFDQDPYLIHYGRVNFDGSQLTWLTAGNGNHTIQYSPDRRFLIDTYSRVDAPPVVELRRVSDGGLILPLEQADISRLQESGWRAPEVFTAKGRDGQTDIWGIICRPRDFDPAKRYAVIEDIYAGPQGSFVPKSFSANQRYENFGSEGFIVVKIDGMGTANRSKHFHDVCWHNLKDAGFRDRILWMQAAASRYPEMDLSRVGIFGTSAGGQNAAAAVLFHPEFYKVAVASCGCHDNRMDKASWNEQWMGYPVGPHYGECSNIDNAHRLVGKLMLIVGEMDKNVPPESTLRFADALIRADKDFDLLVIPNAGHGNGGAYGQRRMMDFFVRHLKN